MADRLKTFTEEEKRLAEKNHDLVYQFLKAHNYSMEDYYNIVVFGYLKGIQKYPVMLVINSNRISDQKTLNKK